MFVGIRCTGTNGRTDVHVQSSRRARPERTDVHVQTSRCARSGRSPFTRLRRPPPPRPPGTASARPSSGRGTAMLCGTHPLMRARNTELRLGRLPHVPDMADPGDMASPRGTRAEADEAQRVEAIGAALSESMEQHAPIDTFVADLYESLRRIPVISSVASGPIIRCIPRRSSTSHTFGCVAWSACTGGAGRTSAPRPRGPCDAFSWTHGVRRGAWKRGGRARAGWRRCSAGWWSSIRGRVRAN